VFKGLGNLASLLRHAHGISGRMGEMAERLKSQRTKGVAGGGMVEIEINGVGQAMRVHIDAVLIESRDREMLQDLVRAAVSDANQKARQLHLEAMHEMTGGISVPGLDDLLSQLGASPNEPGSGGDAERGKDQE
jgi:hypothetical protein